MIQIVYDLDTRKVGVLAPMNNKPLCREILREAHQAIKNYQPPLLRPAPALLEVQ